MFTRLFGENDELQIHNLQMKVILTGLGIILCIIGNIFSAIHLESVGGIALSVGGIVLFVALFMWGFGAIRTLLGFGTIGAIFSGNVVFGVVIFIFCVMIAYLISIIVAFLGVGRYIYLIVKKSQEGRR